MLLRAAEEIIVDCVETDVVMSSTCDRLAGPFLERDDCVGGLSVEHMTGKRASSHDWQGVIIIMYLSEENIW